MAQKYRVRKKKLNNAKGIATKKSSVRNIKCVIVLKRK